MKKLSADKRKILFLIVIAAIFLIALGIILLLVFLNNEKSLQKDENSQEKIINFLDTKFGEPIDVDNEAVEEFLNTENKSNVEIDQQAILNLLNSK
ncbi:MAG: hypothetical protein WC309_00775 [Candidatus Paceibacterota bacterium]|jgi:uncharacterized protein YpmS